MTKSLLAVTVVFAFLTGCRNLTVPSEAPTLLPGTLQGTLVFSEPGRPGYEAAAQAKIQVLSTGLSATADDEGRFLLTGIAASAGVVLVEHEHHGVKRQRTLRLQDVGAGRGRDISLGQVVLSRNAVVHGRVTLEGQPNATGLNGTTVFVPGGPWSALTADDGSYTLDALPEGALQISFFHAGYAVNGLDVQLAPGEEQTLRAVTLVPAVDGPATVHGKVVKADGSVVENAEVRVRSRGMEQTVAVVGDGFSLSNLSAGVYAFAIERDGSLSIAVYNVAVLPGDNDLGTFELIDGTSSQVNLGTGDPGGSPDGGVTDGGHTGPIDAGSGPFAVATGPEVAAPGSQVTLNGMGSTGDFPLIYRWLQTAGTAVSLSVNDTALAHSPRFTAPAAGTVVEMKLVVEDRLGNLSAPSTVRVGIGTKPVARFTPDAGAVFPGGQTVSFTSTSFDDAGVVLTFHDWKLASGSGGVLMTDGGPTAFWQTPAVNFGDPDAIGGLTLQVTNGIGVRSNVEQQLYTVRGVSPNNWTLDAGPTQSIAVGASPPQVQLNASIAAPLIPSPQYDVSWSCTPTTSLVNGNTLMPRFVAPVVVGATQTLNCDVTATGQFPLSPMVLTGRASVLLRDAAPPTVLSSNVEATRTGRFGVLVHASEPLSAAALSMNCNPSLAYGMVSRLLFKSAIAGTQYVVITEGASCNTFAADMTDQAQFPNAVSNVPFGNGTVTVSTVWAGPYISSATFVDPRPVVSTLSQVPGEAQEAAGVVPGAVAGYELVATEAASLIRFGGLDVAQRPTCNPSCVLSNTAVNLGLPAGAVPTGHRAMYAGAELFVAASTDGGVAPFAARRNASGTWSGWPGLTGTPDNWGTEMRTARFESSTGRILVDTWSPGSQQFTTTDVAAAGLSEAPLVASASNVVAAATGPTRALLIRKRNTTDLSWSTFTPSSTHTNVTSLRWEPLATGLLLLGVESGAMNALSLVRADAAGMQTFSTTPVMGYDVASWGGNVYVVYSSGGDIRLKTIAGSVWSGAGGGPVDFGGPPRPGFTAPYPVALDADPACEAVYPSMAFVEDALVITWQERCSPATAWNVVARTVR
ncbi:MAG: hypothetical protein K1X64_04290 [Myxococcaceae bacterium]|nr:hypothetical protein [Myxococcaceae bacterium]